MAYKHLEEILHGAKNVSSTRSGTMHLNMASFHCSGEAHEEILPYEWYEKAFPKITRMTHLLKNVDMVDGQLLKVDDDSVIVDSRVEQKMLAFKSIARVFLGSPSIQQNLHNDCPASVCFSKPSGREPMIVDSLTKVSNFLNISAQQRKLVRHNICPQVTQHRIWAGALEETLSKLNFELEALNCQGPNEGTKMAQQIVYNCMKFLADTTISHDPDSTSWMRLAPTKAADYPGSPKWEDMLEMFNDLISCLERYEGLLCQVTKLKVMKEGLAQVRDVLVDKSIGYKEARHQERLVQKKLSKYLGHSSKCLFTLLLYYLYGSVRNIEVDMCGGVYRYGCENRFSLCMGRILTSDDEKMVWAGVKQLERALGLFKFVWETAGMNGTLELLGHLWCVGANARVLTYKGNMFFVHGMNL